MRYYSENKNSVTLRIAPADKDLTESDEKEEWKIEEIVDKYYPDVNLGYGNADQNNVVLNDDCRKSSSSEEYTQLVENDNNLQRIQLIDVKNSDTIPEISNMLFSESEKNKIIYSCYYCDSEISQHEYEKHIISNHEGKLAYPSIKDLERYNVKPKGYEWE